MWPLLNSAARCSAMAVHTGSEAYPSLVRRKLTYISCSSSEVGATHQSM